MCYLFLEVVYHNKVGEEWKDVFDFQQVSVFKETHGTADQFVSG
jgi:hypothetical protein